MVANSYKMKFGKHKGKELKDVDAQYLIWLNENVAIDKELKNYVEANIKKLKEQADLEHAQFMYDYCDGEVCVQY